MTWFVSYELIQKTGFDVVNLDLIVGLVGETEASFMESLDRTINLRPDSVTIYQLEMPLNTPLFRSFRKGKVGDALADWTTKRARLAKGFKRLEKADFRLRSAYTAARTAQGERFVYQDAQYRGADLLGIGTSSFSYLGGNHYQNVSSLEVYLGKLSQGRLPVSRGFRLSKEERLVREFVLQLKLDRLDRAQFHRRFQVDVFDRFAAPLERCVEQGWMQVDGDTFLLTRDGLLQVDRLIPTFYLPEHQGIRCS